MRLCADCPADISDRRADAIRCVPCAQARRRALTSAWGGRQAPRLHGLPRHDTSVFAAQHEAVQCVFGARHPRQPPTRQHRRPTVAGA